MLFVHFLLSIVPAMCCSKTPESYSADPSLTKDLEGRVIGIRDTHPQSDDEQEF
jgi:hypothetical protein